MSDVVEKNLEKMETLVKMFEMSMTKEEFVDAFEKVVKLVLRNEERLAGAIARLEETHQVLTERNRSDYVTGLTDLKGQVNELFVGDQLKRMDGETKASIKKIESFIDGKIRDAERKIDDRISKVKDGYTPIKGVDFFDGLHGKDGKDIDLAIIEELKKEVEEIKRTRTDKPMGRAKVPMPRTIDLTSDQNGIARTFNIPPDTVRIFGAMSSQFPYAIASGDIDRAGNQITLDDTIAPRERGQTLILFTDALFYP